MDEPTTALDVVVQREILQQIHQLREEFGFSILFITHDSDGQLCDRIAIMRRGIVEVNRSARFAVIISTPTPKSCGVHSYSRTCSRHSVLGASMSQPIMQVKNPVKEFTGGGDLKEEIFRALHGVSFDLYPGRTLALVGESGCGKSTKRSWWPQSLPTDRGRDPVQWQRHLNPQQPQRPWTTAAEHVTTGSKTRLAR